MMNLNTITRRYTPPTCTLQIQARRSPLSRWQPKPIVKHLRFELRFDDPRQLRERHEQLVVRGDRDQLDALCDTVTTYVQDVVLQASAAMPLRSQTVAAEPESTAGRPLSKPPLRADELPVAPAVDPVIPSLVSRARGLYLQPHGLLQHQLYLGNLASGTAQTSVQLSITQLFDLAMALDEYSAEVEALPTLRHSTSLPGQGLPSWTRTAASVIIALGLTTAAMRLSQYWQNQPVAEMEESIAQGDEPILDQPPLGLDAVPPLPGAPPLPEPALPSELENLETLPPPGGVGSLDAPLPQTADPRDRGRRAGGSGAAAEESDASGAPPTAAAGAPPRQGTPNNQRQLTLPRPDETPRLPNNLPPVASAPRPAARPAPERRSPAPTADALRTFETESRAARPVPARPPVNLPQVAEVRQYFQARWQPPDNLSGALEYRLWLNRDGSLQRIAPASSTAATFLDRTRMPLLGEPFVSPLSDSRTPQVRLVLGVDGSVQTSLEALD